MFKCTAIYNLNGKCNRGNYARCVYYLFKLHSNIYLMKKYLSYFILLSIMLFSSHLALSQAAKKFTADKQRALQWKPEKGQYYFSHSIVMDFDDKVEKKKGEIKIYFDPVSGAMCFQKESSFRESGKDFDFIIAFQDGRYLHCGVDENGKKIKNTEKVTDVKPNAEEQAQQKENFETYCIATGNKRTDFGLESIEYDLSYATSENKDKLWITTMPFNIYPLYGFELIEVAASLPASFDYLYLLGPYQLLSELNSKDFTLKLKNIGPDPFLAITRNYQEVKVND